MLVTSRHHHPVIGPGPAPKLNLRPQAQVAGLALEAGELVEDYEISNNFGDTGPSLSSQRSLIQKLDEQILPTPAVPILKGSNRSGLSRPILGRCRSKRAGHPHYSRTSGRSQHTRQPTAVRAARSSNITPATCLRASPAPSVKTFASRLLTHLQCQPGVSPGIYSSAVTVNRSLPALGAQESRSNERASTLMRPASPAAASLDPRLPL